MEIKGKYFTAKIILKEPKYNTRRRRKKRRQEAKEANGEEEKNSHWFHPEEILP